MALRGLLNRYTEVLQHAWKIRRELDTPLRLSYEAEFLPAHLEIVDTPVHPAPLWVVRAIGALALAITAVALLGHLDIIAIAHGKLVPNARVKIIQPAVTGVVRSILVRNGTRVVAGQLLLELDPSQAAADTDKASSARMDAALAAARAQALLRAQAENEPPALPLVAGVPQERLTQVQLFAAGIHTEYRDKMASLRSQLEQREAQLRTVRDEIEKLKVVAPMARQQASNYQSLVEKKYVSRDSYLEKERTALEDEGDLRTANDRVLELSAAVEGQKQLIATTAATFRREQLSDLEVAQQALAQYTNDHTKAVARQSLMRLTAPVAGTVQNLAVHTVGGVVTTAQALLEIVPQDTLEVEASVENKDIGFIAEGQDVVVKIEAFPYTRFGYLKGKVLSVSNNAVRDRANALQYVVRVGLPANYLMVGNRKLSLTPGMQVVTEMYTGRRTVAEYFLSPFVETLGQSMVER